MVLIFFLKAPEIEPKKQFSGSFWEVFGLRLLMPYELHPNLLPNLTSYGGTYSWYVSLVWHLWLSSYKCSNVFVAMQHPWNHLFAGFLSPISPKYGTSLLKFWPEVVSNKKKAVSKQSFKIKCLCGNGTYPKLKVWVHFWAQFIPGKSKILPKTRIFPKTTSLQLSNNISTRSQINQRILIKLIKKSIFRAKMDFLR